MKERSVAQLIHLLRCSESLPALGTYRTVAAEGETAESAAPVIAVGASGTVHVLLPVPTGAAVLEDKRSASVHLVRHEMVLENGQRRLFADLVCLNGALEPTFSLLADEVLRETKLSSLRADAVAKKVLEAWRHLLEKDAGVLSEQELLGLFGELWTLRSLNVGAKTLASWTGGARLPGRHDFRLGPDALEVKTSASTQRDVVHVNGLGQMLPPAGGRLFLRRIRIEEAPSGLSVPDLVELLQKEGMPALELLNSLVVRGYDASKADQYRPRKFEVRDDSAWHVSGSFPRLLAGHFVDGQPPVGVHISSYEIDLAFARESKLSQVQFDAELKKWSEGM